MRSFYHAGDVGDLVYGLYVMKVLGGGELLLGERTTLGQLQPRVGIRRDMMLNLVGFLKSQPYVNRVQWMAQPPFVTHDLNAFRKHWLGQLPGTGRDTHLLEMHCVAFGVPFHRDYAWLESAAQRKAGVVVARSARQRNWRFPWREVVRKYKGNLVFVGTSAEYVEFMGSFGQVPRAETPTLEHLMKVIAGCDLFIGNSSAPLAVAEGLKKRVLQETSLETVERAHTRSMRANAVDWYGGMELPDV